MRKRKSDSNVSSTDEKKKKAKKTQKTKTQKQQPVLAKKKKTPATQSKVKTKTAPTKKSSDDSGIYPFKNYFVSEKKLSSITHDDAPEEIIEAFGRVIYMYASQHVREGVELEDLIGEARTGVLQAIDYYNDSSKPRKKYSFVQYCLYKIREAVTRYCLRNASMIKTPYYLQRGCMHVGQIFKLMQNQSVAESVLNRPGPASEQEIIDFIYNENERLPLKPKNFIKAHINQKLSKKEKEQVLQGVMNHELGSRHSYVKKNLSDTAKVLHIKEKMVFTAHSNAMSYTRVVDLILSARQQKTELTPLYSKEDQFNINKNLSARELISHGRLVCGEPAFDIFFKNKVEDKSYDELAVLYKKKKQEVVDCIKQCQKVLQKDKLFLEVFGEL